MIYLCYMWYIGYILIVPGRLLTGRFPWTKIPTLTQRFCRSLTCQSLSPPRQVPPYPGAFSVCFHGLVPLTLSYLQSAWAWDITSSYYKHEEMSKSLPTYLYTTHLMCRCWFLFKAKKKTHQQLQLGCGIPFWGWDSWNRSHPPPSTPLVPAHPARPSSAVFTQGWRWRFFPWSRWFFSGQVGWNLPWISWKKKRCCFDKLNGHHENLMFFTIILNGSLYYDIWLYHFQVLLTCCQSVPSKVSVSQWLY